MSRPSDGLARDGPRDRACARGTAARPRACATAPASPPTRRCRRARARARRPRTPRAACAPTPCAGVEQLLGVLLHQAPVLLEAPRPAPSFGRLLDQRRERLATREEQVRRQVRRLGLLARHRQRRLDVERHEPDDVLRPRRRCRAGREGAAPRGRRRIDGQGWAISMACSRGAISTRSPSSRRRPLPRRGAEHRGDPRLDGRQLVDEDLRHDRREARLVLDDERLLLVARRRRAASRVHPGMCEITRGMRRGRDRPSPSERASGRRGTTLLLMAGSRSYCYPLAPAGRTVHVMPRRLRHGPDRVAATAPAPRDPSPGGSGREPPREGRGRRRRAWRR